MEDVQPQAAGGAPPKSSLLTWLLLGCGGCFVALILFFAVVGGGAFLAAEKLTEPAKTEAKAFLQEAAAGEADRAYAHFSDELKKVQDLETFKKLVAEHKDVFALSDPSFNRMEYKDGQVVLEGTATNAKQESKAVSFKLIEQGGKWKLLAYHLAE